MAVNLPFSAVRTVAAPFDGMLNGCDSTEHKTAKLYRDSLSLYAFEEQRYFMVGPTEVFFPRGIILGKYSEFLIRTSSWPLPSK